MHRGARRVDPLSSFMIMRVLWKTGHARRSQYNIIKIIMDENPVGKKPLG
jgi:hypothetical protein